MSDRSDVDIVTEWNLKALYVPIRANWIVVDIVTEWNLKIIWRRRVVIGFKS